MHAHRYDDGKLYNLGSYRFVKSHGLPEPIVEVDVVEVAEDDPAATHWGWIFKDETEPSMCHWHRGCLEICFPYGSKIEEQHGKGRAVRLAVREVSGSGE